MDAFVHGPLIGGSEMIQYIRNRRKEGMGLYFAFNSLG